jgi:hypothetical protein
MQNTAENTEGNIHDIRMYEVIALDTGCTLDLY